MALILNIETATNICSVALAKDGQVIASRESGEDKSHARLLAPFIDEIFRQSPERLQQLDAVAVSEGPGSYTGLRIGVSTAKGMAYGLQIPLLAVSTLQAMAMEAAANKPQPGGVYIPMIDARRKEVYAAVFDVQNHFMQETQAVVLNAESFMETQGSHLFIFGDGAEKARTILKDTRIDFLEVQAGAGAMAPLAEQAFARNKTVDVAYFEPFYLKDFIPTIPRKNVFK